MAIDSTVYAEDIPAGTYAVGDIIPLVNIDGPANVRSGRGSAILKNIFVASATANTPRFRVHVKNSDWVDDVSSVASAITTLTSLNDDSGCCQRGHDCALTPNSGWQVYAECIAAGTPTGANSVFVIIDVDYPQVSSITDPATIRGIPASITLDKANVNVAAFGSMVGSTWSIDSIDYFKAGYEYALDKVEVFTGSPTFFGLLAFSNAAGMGGLQRIIPITSLIESLRYKINYASKLQKGPMDIKLKLFNTAAGTTDVKMIHDYVKRGAA